MVDVDPLSQIEIQQQIRALIDEANRNTTEHAKAVRRAYHAEREFEIAMAKSRRMAQGTVQEKEDQALIRNEALYFRHMDAKAVLKASEQAGRNIRASLEACRTLASDIRAAVTNATGVGA